MDEETPIRKSNTRLIPGAGSAQQAFFCAVPQRATKGFSGQNLPKSVRRSVGTAYVPTVLTTIGPFGYFTAGLFARSVRSQLCGLEGGVPLVPSLTVPSGSVICGGGRG